MIREEEVATMSEAHAALIGQFYNSFQARQAQGMAECYHPEVVFSDPVFPRLVGPEAGAMWAMLLARASDLNISFSDIKADAHEASVHWVARYSFSATKRPVVNRISARFSFQDGKIIRHIDSFNLWRWSAQALGPMGLVLGWTPLVQGKIRRQAAEALHRYQEKA